MNSLLRSRVLRAVIAALAILVADATRVEALPIASLEYLEADLGGGLWQYDFTLRNESDPVIDAGSDVYDFALFYSSLTSLISFTTPTDWDLIAGAGFIDTFSLQPGASPFGTDVGPGQTLAGFRFVFDAQVGALPFQVVFANPGDPSNPIVQDGVTTPSESASVPEPSSLSLAVIAIGMWVATIRRRSKAITRVTAVG